MQARIAVPSGQDSDGLAGGDFFAGSNRRGHGLVGSADAIRVIDGNRRSSGDGASESHDAGASGEYLRAHRGGEIDPAVARQPVVLRRVEAA
ncbi:hypothetical protein CATYP_04060 [Corynebacterium atypicum]|uniref:Uncharacterized protein n=1 Tax=Corynebacterium atypicum TaxID=191610 RepID=A0ABN4DCL0_9CORY|nr:hypothetical protein CATYP_04060 [Corynebacterium atypicum]